MEKCNSPVGFDLLGNIHPLSCDKKKNHRGRHEATIKWN